MQQMRNVAPVANVDLLPGVMDRGVIVRRILQLDHAQRHAVHIQQNVRAAGFCLSVVGVLNCELVDGAEEIVFRLFKVDQRHHAGRSALWRELNSVDHPAIDLVQRCKIALRANKTHIVHDLAHLFCQQIRIGLAQKLLQIVGVQNLPAGSA